LLEFESVSQCGRRFKTAKVVLLISGVNILC